MNNSMKNILVVDEDIDITSFIKHGLEYFFPAEYHVLCVNCIEKCFEVLKNGHILPDVILLDITMPSTDVWKILNQLKSNSQLKNIHIIFLSPTGNTVSNNFRNFFDIYLIEKPFEIENLSILIERVLK